MIFHQLWRSGQPVYGFWFAYPNLLVIEQASRMGFDWVCLDLEHGAAEPSDLLPVMLAAGSTPVIIRVRWNDPGLIMRALDTGATGVLVPMVNNAEDARKAAGACRYGTEGYRSFGHMRSHVIPNYSPSTGNRFVLCVVMIETTEAVDNIDEILSVPGVDAAFIGRFDMAVSAGLEPAQARTHPDQLNRIRTVIEACKRHGVPVAMKSGADTPRWRAEGVQLLSVADDRALLNAAADLLKSVKKTEA
jgi:4-hydroxy-2-oxoheptanedioate aldolase